MSLTPTVRKKAASLSLFACVISGCAQSDLNVSPARSPSWKRTPNTQVAGIHDVAPPKILPETHFSAGKLYESQGLLNKAMIQYRKAIASNHQYVAAYHRLALLLSRTGDHAHACALFAKAVAISPDDPVLHNNYGYELLLTKRWHDASDEFQRAIDLKPEFTRAHINLGIAQSRIGLYEEALTSFRQVLPEPDAYYNLGLMHRAQGRLRLAAGCFQHVLRLNDAFTAAKTQLAVLEPQLKLMQPPTPDPVMEEMFAGTCDAPEEELASNVEFDQPVDEHWCAADMLNYPDPNEMSIAQADTFCEAPYAASGDDINSCMGDDVASIPDWEDDEIWETVRSGNFTLNFQQDDFQLTDFLSVLDNEFRCREDMEQLNSTNEVVTQALVPTTTTRPTMSATVIEVPLLTNDPVFGPTQNSSEMPIQDPDAEWPPPSTAPHYRYQHKQPMEPKHPTPERKPRASNDSGSSDVLAKFDPTLDANKRDSTMTPAATNRALDLGRVPSSHRSHLAAPGSACTFSTFTANGSLVLNESEGTAMDTGEPTTLHPGITIERAPRMTLPYRIVGSPGATSHAGSSRARRAAATLDSIRDLNAQLDIVQNEIHCIDEQLGNASSHP